MAAEDEMAVDGSAFSSRRKTAAASIVAGLLQEAASSVLTLAALAEERACGAAAAGKSRSSLARADVGALSAGAGRGASGLGLERHASAAAPRAMLASAALRETCSALFCRFLAAICCTNLFLEDAQSWVALYVGTTLGLADAATSR